MRKSEPTELISVAEAWELVQETCERPATVRVALENAAGRVLAASVRADRDLPPYHRATMDGIALKAATFQAGRREFKRQAYAAAGMPGIRLEDLEACIEIATGAVLPQGADAVVRYEDLTATGQGFCIHATHCQPGQNIHAKGSDARKGDILVPMGRVIRPAEIGVLASVGCTDVEVFALPRICLISSGDELVEPHRQPEPHQIRSSNLPVLRAALEQMGMAAELLHLPDHKEVIAQQLSTALRQHDVLIITGGVSMGKFDFLPSVLLELGVEQRFHRVAQRPGKPLWFGWHRSLNCRVFSLPGNPVSAFLNFHLYFRDWFQSRMGLPRQVQQARLAGSAANHTLLTHFRPATLVRKEGHAWAHEVPMNNSGDFQCLSKASCFMVLEPGIEDFAEGTLVPVIPFSPWE
ncbi:molybdopterin molybdotransferase MoeA [Robiginitalea sp. M366]|uniref:molybdopterin molybdotransferase MoeA n=1 Tax=Robiginitalea aestuariiviva TaxID=3036903 RepID=UPI00240E1CE0|nr:molybdopterin molybdotransferase MoeA [Robiginitalea aestuariiviva]MDG1572921.1 molybdopterin molybdotransferase MoeA [Robiginitalea aestuariiviva]